MIEAKERHVSIGSIYVVAVALLVLWLLSWGLSYLHLGRASIVVALGIAGVKAILVALVFMELATERFSMHAAVLAALALVAVLMFLTILDVETRAQSPMLPPSIEYRAEP